MRVAEWKRWLKNHPHAVLKCKFCGEKLGKDLVINGQDFHSYHLNLKSQAHKIEMAVHAGDPFPAQYRFRCGK